MTQVTRSAKLGPRVQGVKVVRSTRAFGGQVEAPAKPVPEGRVLCGLCLRNFAPRKDRRLPLHRDRNNRECVGSNGVPWTFPPDRDLPLSHRVWIGPKTGMAAVSGKERRAAALTIADHSESAEDCQHLLQMCGLLP